MPTRARIQFIRSLEQKKCRDESGMFLAEGEKIAGEALALSPSSGYSLKAVYALPRWLGSHPEVYRLPGIDVEEVSESVLARISLLKTPNQVVALIGREPLTARETDTASGLMLGLDQIQDPGNVGTIVRLADWFGLDGVAGSPDSADFFSPKVVQASMGSVFRVRLVTTDLALYIRKFSKGFPVYGTTLDGENLYDAELSDRGMILLGNESRGLDPGLAALAAKNLKIPDYAAGAHRPESLNVSIAAAVICSEFRRRGTGGRTQPPVPRP